MSEIRCLSVARTDPGRVRAINEDAFLDRPDLGLWVVADGMGGHDAGDLASRLIVDELGRIRKPASGAALMAEVKTRVQSLNRQLRDEAQLRGPDSIIAATIVGLLVIDGFFACFWAGDSRLYLLRAGRLMQVTRDHSYVQELVDKGALTAEQAERHPQSNVVTRAVGAEDELELELKQARLLPEDTFLLCSDGLFKPVSAEGICDILIRVPFEAAPDALIAAALEGGGPDNVTAVLVKSVA